MSRAGEDFKDHEGNVDRLPSKLTRGSTKNAALENAIHAAETSLQALKLARDPIEQKTLSARVKHLLAEAEQIKSTTDWPGVTQLPPANTLDSNAIFRRSTNGNSNPLREPQSTRKLPTSEQILLLKASWLNGFKFPPWTAPPQPSEFELKDGEDVFLYVSSIVVAYAFPLMVSSNQRHAIAAAF